MTIRVTRPYKAVEQYTALSLGFTNGLLSFLSKSDVTKLFKDCVYRVDS